MPKAATTIIISSILREKRPCIFMTAEGWILLPFQKIILDSAVKAFLVDIPNGIFESKEEGGSRLLDCISTT